MSDIDRAVDRMADDPLLKEIARLEAELEAAQAMRLLAEDRLAAIKEKVEIVIHKIRIGKPSEAIAILDKIGGKE
jgi:hypothetical protein